MNRAFVSYTGRVFVDMMRSCGKVNFHLLMTVMAITKSGPEHMRPFVEEEVVIKKFKKSALTKGMFKKFVLGKEFTMFLQLLS